MTRPGLSQMGALAASSLMVLGLMGCLQSTLSARAARTQPDPMPVSSSTHLVAKSSPMVNSQLVTANTRFGFNLFHQLLKQQPGQNVFISPSSVAIALAMTYNGASGETQQAMRQTLELQGLSLAALNQAHANLRASLENPDPQVKLAIANSLWANQKIPLKPEFLQRNQEFYGAKVTNLNFADPKAPSVINQWVEKNTNGKIPQIVDSVRPDDLLYLINAIYFKGDWTVAFDRRLTANQPFYLAAGKQKLHPLMSQTGDYRYLETDQFQAVSLPYGKQRRMSLYVFLPKESSNLSSFLTSLTEENWQSWMKQFRTRSGSVQMPRFKLEYNAQLKPALTALGMGVAFNPAKADFSGISAAPARIDEVKHKTFVEVNEEGTEAAAVTSVGIRMTSAPIEGPFTLKVDRPFFTAIRDNQTGEILFMGTIVDPKI